ncbi:hypothetical protein V8F20_006398 [Naviculisporaceae sp. PSN 640]
MKAPFLLLAVASIVKAEYWLEEIQHRGVSPYSGSPTYQVFRDVRQFGAIGDGVHDDTDAIQRAISNQTRCGGMSGCSGSTKTPATVYFPPGTYLISKPLIDYYYTQLIGDPNDMPVLKAASTFPRFQDGAGIINGDEYMNSPMLEFGATNVFYRQIRNLVFDTRAVAGSVNAIHWPSSQATSIQNCVFYLSSNFEYQHTGIFIEGGSGGTMSDLVFNGGKWGARFGNQQYTMRNLTFTGCETAIHQIWNWGWTYKSLNINQCKVGLNMSSLDVGSVTVLDSVFNNVTIAMVTGRNDTTGRGSLMTENVNYTNTNVVLMGPKDTALLLGNPQGKVTARGYASGNLYAPYGPVSYNGGDGAYFHQPWALKDGWKYYERSKPQYEDWDVGQILSARDVGAAGDGKTDDTKALNRLFNQSSSNEQIAFIDAGHYIVTDTVYIPGGTRIVGEALAAIIIGSGEKLSDMNSPYPVVEIGKRGEVGIVEISDVIVSTRGPAAGAVLIEFNLNCPVSGANGSDPPIKQFGNRPSGLWDVHVRIGGYDGSRLQAAECPTTPNQVDYVNPNCIGAYMSMHITPSAKNLYMENCWFWTADHDMDDPLNNATQVSVFAGRGLLVDNAVNIWLVGTAAEHHTLYQYQILNSTNIFIAQAQTETPYHQPNPPAPAPFYKLNTTIYDPDFTFDCNSTAYFEEFYINDSMGDNLPGAPPCAMAWGMRILGSSNVVAYGMGLYSFFNNYNVECSQVAKGNEICQARIFWLGPILQDSTLGRLHDLDPPLGPNATHLGGRLRNVTTDISVYNLATVGSVSMVTRLGTDVADWLQNRATFATALAVFKF